MFIILKIRLSFKFTFSILLPCLNRSQNYVCCTYITSRLIGISNTMANISYNYDSIVILKIIVLNIS